MGKKLFLHIGLILIFLSAAIAPDAFAQSLIERQELRRKRDRMLTPQFSLVNLNTDKVITKFRSLKDGAVIPAKYNNLAIRVSVAAANLSSVTFKVNGEEPLFVSSENRSSKRAGQINTYKFDPVDGDNLLEATSFIANSRRVRLGKQRIIRVYKRTNATPTPSSTPAPEPTPQPTNTPAPTPTPRGGNPEPTPTPVPPTSEPTATPEFPTPTPTPATPTPTPVTPTPTPVPPTPAPTPVPQGPTCTGGADKVIALPASSVALSGVCGLSGITSINWTQTMGPKTAGISSQSSLTPTISGLTADGFYQFSLRVEHAGGVVEDTVNVGVSKQVSGYAYSLGVKGAKNVTRGFNLYLNVEMEQSGGSQDYVYVAVSGLPAGISYSMPDWKSGCCGGGNYGWSPYTTLMELRVASNVTLGTYPITISISSGGVVKQVAHSITVNAVPADLTSQHVSSNPAVPMLAQWQANMTHFGNLWCNAGTISTWEGSVWYYDGMRIYYQLADYTGNSYYANTCVPIVRNIFQPMVTAANGGVQGWRVFPHGFKEDYLRTGNTVARTAALALAQNSAWAGSGGNANPEVSRETAYLINAYTVAEDLGASEHAMLQRAVDFALGHIDQWAVSQSEVKIKPFMAALTSEALIKYYERTGDPRIPTAIQKLADWLWSSSGTWHSASQSFLYVNANFPGEDPSEPAPDLNLLIAPIFGWLYHQTGDVKYQQRGDQIFAGGIPTDNDHDGFYEGGACLGCTGKIFSQNYRWSIKYVNWRQTPP